MRPTATFIELIRSIGSANFTRVLDELTHHLAHNVLTIKQLAATVRHLETLAFQLDGSNRLGDAARVYDLIAALIPLDHKAWQMEAFEARLRELIAAKKWAEATNLIADIGSNDYIRSSSRKCIQFLLRNAWQYECCYAAEEAIQCYRLAHDLNRGDAGIATEDGDTIRAKIRKIRVLQMNLLAEAGRHEEAIGLHEATRTITGLGPVGIFNIVSAHEASTDKNGVYHEILPSRAISAPKLRFLDGSVELASEAGSLDAPPQYVCLFKDCLTFPRSNLVIHGNRLIYDLAAHPRNGLAEIKDGVNPDQIMQAVYGAGRALIEIPNNIREIDAGLMLFGFQSRNYGHWILEFAPRMIWFNNPVCPADYPIYIDEHMPDSHRQIVELLDDRGREVLSMPNSPARFRELAVAPVPAFFPFDIRPGMTVYDTIWPKDVLSQIRTNVFRKLEINHSLSKSKGRRLFLSRQGFTQRRLVNEFEISTSLDALGFETINPAELTFSDQIRLFSSAEIIVGSASSALTNCLFCNPNAKVLALIHDNRAFNFRGYASMIAPSGAELLFLRGISIKKEGTHPFHLDYYIELKDVLRGIRELGGAL